MTEPLFRKDAYLQTCEGVVVGHTDQGGVIVDKTVFYPTGGGQPGDKGRLEIDGVSLEIVNTIKADGDAIALQLCEGIDLPPIGATVTQVLDWGYRYRLMRVHTMLHLLSVVIPLPVSGGQISAEKGRLDFNMPDALEDKQAVEDALNDLISRNLFVSQSWITDAELAARPEMVKTMSVKPPTGAGHVRLIRIGTSDEQVDLQPCGGTHVANSSEIGRVRMGKVEKKGKQNRRVNVHLVE